MPHPTVLLAVLLLVLGACDQAPADRGPNQVSLAASATVDLRFDPVDWVPGERLVVQVGAVQLQSEARPTGHAVELVAPGRRVLRVEGLVDGGVSVTETPPAPDGPTVSGGTTSEGPTSIHKATVCQAGTCSEIIEYDYDRTAEDGNGTTVWERPSGRRATVDRVRFVLSDPGSSETALLHVTSPEPLKMVR